MTLVNNDILKVTFQMSYPDAQKCQNVYRLQFHTIGSISDAAALAHITDWLEDVYDTLADEIKSTMTIDPCPVDIEEWVVDEWVITRNVGYATPSVTFLNTGELLPKQCSAFGLFKTERPKSNGRKFLPAFTESDTEFGYLTAGALAAMADYAAAVLAGFVVDVDTFFVAGIVRVAVDLFLPSILAVVTDTMFTQRRRVRGVGI